MILSRCGISRLNNPFDGNADPGKQRRITVNKVHPRGAKIEDVSFLVNAFIGLEDKIKLRVCFRTLSP